MKYVSAENFTEDFALTADVAAAVGNFDGLHAGHLRVLDELRGTGAEMGLLTAVVSFFPHPSVIKGAEYKYLFTRAEKAELLREMGIDYYIEYPFDRRVAGMRPREFFADVLIGRLRARAVIVGEGFRFGAGAEGNADMLHGLGKEFGVCVKSVGHYGADSSDGKISSSEIKRLILQKNFSKASELLTRDYFVTLKNGETEREKILPPDGVYAVKIIKDGADYDGTARIADGKVTIDGVTQNAKIYFTGFSGLYALGLCASGVVSAND